MSPVRRYDPVRIYCDLARVYHWPWEAIDRMHYLTVFAAYREATLAMEREEAQYRQARHGSAPAAPATGWDGEEDTTFLRHVTRPVPWDGAVVARTP